MHPYGFVMCAEELCTTIYDRTTRLFAITRSCIEKGKRPYELQSSYYNNNITMVLYRHDDRHVAAVPSTNDGRRRLVCGSPYSDCIYEDVYVSSQSPACESFCIFFRLVRFPAGPPTHPHRNSIALLALDIYIYS